MLRHAPTTFDACTRLDPATILLSSTKKESLNRSAVSDFQRGAASRRAGVQSRRGEKERTFMSIDAKNADRSAQTSSKPRREKTPRERVMPPVVYQLPGLDGV